jgi:signal transduction histidine kinase
MLGGMILPVFGPRGSVGIVGVFSASRAAFSVEQCAVLMVLVQSALGRAEGVQLQQMAEEATAAEVHARLARDIHDGPLQTLLSATLRLRAALAKDRKRPRESLQVLERELAQTARQMRTLIRTLRLARSQGTIEERLKAALSRLKQAKGLTWTLRWRAPERLLQAAVADEIFRVVNEALANVYRHSCAKRVGVMSRRQGNTFEVIVRDDGIGFNVAEGLRRDISRKSFGLISMQERVAALGGTFTLRSQAGRGTRVLIRLPLRQDEKEMDKTA